MMHASFRLFAILLPALLVSVVVLASDQDDTAQNHEYQEPEAGVFLVAKRSLYGPWFSRTVIYLIQHDENGSVGVIVNRPSGKQMHELIAGMDSTELGQFQLFTGGPVSPEKLVMLIRGEYSTPYALHVSDDVYASSSTHMLAQLVIEQKQDNELRMFIGQANWQPGQLSVELEDDYWFVTAADVNAVFSGESGSLWSQLINRLDPVGIMAATDR